MTQQYNLRKGQEFSSAPVWWYTDLKQLIKIIGFIDTHEVIMQAEVPDKLVLLHDADRWEQGPFCSADLGWAGSKLYQFDGVWTEKMDQLWDKRVKYYRENPQAMIETWSEVFNISKKDGTQRIHATTPFIDLSWLDKKRLPISDEDRLSQEM